MYELIINKLDAHDLFNLLALLIICLSCVLIVMAFSGSSFSCKGTTYFGFRKGLKNEQAETTNNES